MAWVPDSFNNLRNVTREEYVFIRCFYCRNIFRWGRLGFRLGIIHCPYCGAIISKPILVDKVEYMQWLQRMQNPNNISSLQKRLWDSNRGDESNYL